MDFRGPIDLIWVSIACTGKKIPRFNTLLICLFTTTVIKVSVTEYEPKISTTFFLYYYYKVAAKRAHVI